MYYLNIHFFLYYETNKINQTISFTFYFNKTPENKIKQFCKAINFNANTSISIFFVLYKFNITSKYFLFA